MTQWRQTIQDLVLTGAAAVVAADRTLTPPAAVSITLTGRSLNIVDLLLSEPFDIDFSGSAGTPDRRCEMTVTPILLDVLNSPPVIQIRATGLSDPIRLHLNLQLRVQNRRTNAVTTIVNEFSDVVLDAQSSAIHLELPLHPFAYGEVDPRER